MPKSIKIFAKVGSKFCQIVNKAFKSCPNILKFAKVAKFSHVWSHCIFVCDDDDVDDDVDEVKACVEVGIVLSVHMMLRL